MGVRVKDDGQFKEIYVKALDGLAVGTSVEYAGTTIPDELKGTWMFERGQELSRTEYAKLFSIIGTSYGAGDGSTTFNLPNKCSRVPVGLDENDTDFNTIGKTGGSKALQQHHHTVGFMLEGVAHSGQGNSIIGKQNTGSNWAGTTDDAGTGNSGNLQPYIVKNFIIKVKETRPLASHTVNAYSESESNAYSCDYVNDLNTYSTTEQRIGTYNGKPLYRKILEINSYTPSTPSTISISSLNMDKLVNISGMTYDGTQHIPIPFANQNNEVNYAYRNGNVIGYYLAYGTSAKITIEYTKTTDTVQSTRSLNTYSGDIEEKKNIVIDDGNK